MATNESSGDSVVVTVGAASGSAPSWSWRSRAIPRATTSSAGRISSCTNRPSDVRGRFASPRATIGSHTLTASRSLVALRKTCTTGSGVTLWARSGLPAINKSAEMTTRHRGRRMLRLVAGMFSGTLSVTVQQTDRVNYRRGADALRGAARNSHSLGESDVRSTIGEPERSPYDGANLNVRRTTGRT